MERDYNMDKEKKMIDPSLEKALFSQRFFAVIIDMIIVFLITRYVISMPIASFNPNISRLDEEMNINTKYVLSGDINLQTYINQSIDINHDIARQTGLITIINILFSIVYFIIIPFHKNGQTIGKKLLRIRVVSSDPIKELTANNFAIRSLIINGILFTMFVLFLALLASRGVYALGILIFVSMQLIITLVCLIGVAVKEDGRGLHDKLACTLVVRDEVKVREEKLCES